MKIARKIVCIVLVLVCLVACGIKDQTVSITKEGTLYQAGNGISFYYPSSYKLEKSSSSEVVEFTNKEDLLFFSTINNEYDNVVDDMKELFKAELEMNEAKNIQVKEPVIESGLKCYEYSGEYIKTGIAFIYLVYFDENYTYIYGYEANKEDYDENISTMITYIETFAKSSGK